jgi:EAL domain-containing protein (putative c-di-GMP-specific phosphodiesterase class I)
MHYQPIIDLETQEIVGFEALMRWEHPQRGFVGPDVFIPLAEQSDTILKLGAFALREATNVASSWTANEFGAFPYVSVNLSVQQLHDPNLLAMIDTALRDSHLSPARLVLEITETSALFDVIETLNVLGELRLKGIDIALDDFGTGYSSLSYLVQLDPNVIKIDGSFVNSSMESGPNELLLESIVALSHKLNVTLLAEGIETERQRNKLIGLGCRFGQGHLYSRAVSARAVGEMLDATTGRSRRSKPQYVRR